MHLTRRKFAQLVLCPLLAFCVAYPQRSLASGFDYSYGAGMRTLPWEAAAFARAGYGHIIWGETQDGGYLYGYVRPELRLQSSILVTRPEISLGIYPVSFVGFHAGHSQSFRFTKLSTIDCGNIECKGRLGTTYVKTKILLGYQALFLSYQLTVKFLSISYAEKSGMPFADEGSSLVGTPGGERSVNNSLVLGMKISEEHGVSAFFETERMLAFKSSNDSESLFYRFNRKDAWSLIAGLGLYRSSTRERGLTIFSAVTFVGSPSVELN